MTTPNIPDLPYTLAVSDWPNMPARNELVLDTLTGETVIAINRFEKCDLHEDADDHAREGGLCFDHGLNVHVDPADLIRELSRFVPIPAEARKVITDWLARPVSTQQTVPERADDLLATLAAAGLLVGPGEPAASEPAETRMDIRARVLGYLRNEIAEEEVVAAIEEHGLTVTAVPATAPSEGTDSIKRAANALLGTTYAIEGTEPIAEVLDRTAAELEREREYAAPSVEQITEALDDWDGDEDSEDVARRIRALWSPAPGDAAEVHSLAWWRQQCNGQESRAIEAEERAAKAEREVADLSDRLNKATYRANHGHAESERYKAEALTAKAYLSARRDAASAEIAFKEAEDAFRVAAVNQTAAYAAYMKAARAAVEADTEGARDE